MRAVEEQVTNKVARVGTDLVRPGQEPARCPLQMRPMSLRQMGGFRRMAPLFAGTNMCGDALSGVENFDDRSRQSDFHFAPRELVWNAVVVTVNFDVLVD